MSKTNEPSTTGRIEKKFRHLAETNKKAVIPFTVLGFPDKETSLRSIEALIAGGAHVLELGLPFSDPMADGPIIEAAAKQTVEQGFSIADALELIATVRQRHPELPIVILSYFNLAFARGVEPFLQQLKKAGADGITFVDLPVEECAETYKQAAAIGLAPVMLVSPLTSPERLAKILEYAEGYIYLVSRAGITGLEETFNSGLKSLINMIKQSSTLPVCIGFGISRPIHVRGMIAHGADGVIVGSKIVAMIQGSQTSFNPDELSAFVQELVLAAQDAVPPKEEKAKNCLFEVPVKDKEKIEVAK